MKGVTTLLVKHDLAALGVAESLTLKAAHWSGAGGVALHPNKPFLAPFQ